MVAPDYLHYQDMPPTIQSLADAFELLKGVTLDEWRGHVAYRFDFEDSFETWSILYSPSGIELGRSGFQEKVR